MSTIDPNSTSVYDSLGLTSRQDTAQSDETVDEFMTLLLTQLENQDPTEPMDNNEFLAQLAQIETAGGIQDLNASVNEFAISMQTNQALQASSLVGRSVAVAGSDVMLNSGSSVEGEIILPSSTSDLQLSIYDGSGQLVRTIGMGTQAAGDVAYTWDGIADDGTPVPSGVYRVSAEAMIDGKPTALTTKTYATVESVSMTGGAQGVELNLAGLGTVSFSDVLQVK